VDDADDRMVADRIGALLEPKERREDDSPEAAPPDILAVQAEIARQVALVLGRQREPGGNATEAASRSPLRKGQTGLASRPDDCSR
jgi:hypothetical protein